jgi:hypothetical protein
MIECGLQDGQHSVSGGAALANTVRALVGLALVRFAAGRRSQLGGLLGKPMMPVLKPLSRQSRDRKDSECRQDMCLGSPSGMVHRATTAAFVGLQVIIDRVLNCVGAIMRCQVTSRLARLACKESSRLLLGLGEGKH